jgi:thioester reductase-like protein
MMATRAIKTRFYSKEVNMATVPTVTDETQATTQNPVEPQGKTFTQEEVNHIVAGRVKKYADYEELKQKAEKFDQMEEANKTELQKATERATALQTELDDLKKKNDLRDLRDEVSKEKGVPANLLTGMTKEECEAQADEIINYAANRPGYPAVTDGGEPTVTAKRTTRDQFADWFENQ